MYCILSLVPQIVWFMGTLGDIPILTYSAKHLVAHDCNIHVLVSVYRTTACTGTSTSKDSKKRIRHEECKRYKHIYMCICVPVWNKSISIVLVYWLRSLCRYKVEPGLLKQFKEWDFYITHTVYLYHGSTWISCSWK